MPNFHFLNRPKKPHKNLIRKKLLLFFFISFAIVNTISLFTYNNTRILSSELNDIFTNDTRLTKLGGTLDSVETSLKAYLTTGHSNDLYNYLNLSNDLRDMAIGFNTELSNDEGDLLFADIKNMLLTYLQTTDFAVQEKRGRDISGYTGQFNEATQIYDYANEYIDKLKIYEFKENNNYYLKLSEKLGNLQVFNMIVIIFAMIIDFILIIFFAYSITEPVIRLSKAASEIAAGNYDIPEIKVSTNDEVRTLAQSFNYMVGSIKRQLVEIHEKAKIESCLKEQEMKNLEMESMLREAELQSLQAQIDPHFMFNTLNAAVQLAMFDGADRTQLFLENFSHLLRYNLGNMSMPSTVLDEISNVENYIYLLNERYGNKIRFSKKADVDFPNVEMPRMTLQPIVENAFIHGISALQSGDLIGVAVAVKSGEVHVIVIDNGCGMQRKTIEKILSCVSCSQNASGERHGIGLKNVISRLMLFYHKKNVNDVIDIESKENVGTKVTVKIPVAGRGDLNV